MKRAVFVIVFTASFIGLGYFYCWPAMWRWRLCFSNYIFNYSLYLLWFVSPWLALIAVWRKRDRWAVGCTIGLLPVLVIGTALLILKQPFDFDYFRRMQSRLKIIPVQEGCILLQHHEYLGYDSVEIVQEKPLFAGFDLRRTIGGESYLLQQPEVWVIAKDRIHVRFRQYCLEGENPYRTLDISLNKQGDQR